MYNNDKVYTQRLNFILNVSITKQMFVSKRTGHLTTSLSDEEVERRRLLEKEWSKYKQDQWLKDVLVIKSIIASQETALKELKAAPKQLYKKAVEVNIRIILGN